MSYLTTLTPPGWQGPADGVPCCWPTMHGDWGDCTCWEPIYDPPEQEPLLPGGAEVMPTMCADCAYRPGSPERMGNPDAAADGYDLDGLAIGGTRFWCHDGMRRVVGMRHAGTGETVEITGQHHYDPPLDARQRPHRTDGTVGSLCAGWDAPASRRGHPRPTARPRTGAGSMSKQDSYSDFLAAKAQVTESVGRMTTTPTATLRTTSPGISPSCAAVATCEKTGA